MSRSYEDGIGRLCCEPITQGLLEGDEDGKKEGERGQKEEEESLNQFYFYVLRSICVCFFKSTLNLIIVIFF